MTRLVRRSKPYAVTMRMTEEEHQELHFLAEKRNLTAAELMRRLAFRNEGGNDVVDLSLPSPKIQRLSKADVRRVAEIADATRCLGLRLVCLEESNLVKEVRDVLCDISRVTSLLAERMSK